MMVEYFPKSTLRQVLWALGLSIADFDNDRINPLHSRLNRRSKRILRVRMKLQVRAIGRD